MYSHILCYVYGQKWHVLCPLYWPIIIFSGILRCTILSLLYTTVQNCTLLHTTIQYCTLMYTTVYYCLLLHTTVHYCTVLWQIWLVSKCVAIVWLRQVFLKELCHFWPAHLWSWAILAKYKDGGVWLPPLAKDGTTKCWTRTSIASLWSFVRCGVSLCVTFEIMGWKKSLCLLIAYLWPAYKSPKSQLWGPPL